MRLNELPRTATSSLPLSLNSGSSKSPVDTLSADCDMRLSGRTISHVSMMFRTMKTMTNTAASDAMNVCSAVCALRSGRSIGTVTSCAPTISLCFQPKPLESP